jgi:hypothetical protein
MNKMPRTLVRVGRYDNHLEEAVARLSVPLNKVSGGLGNTVKYFTFNRTQNPYLLMVSQQKDKILSPSGYNVMLSVTSYSDLMNHEVANRFERESGIDLDVDVPEQVKRQFELLSIAYGVLKNNPGAERDFLRGM